MFFCNKAVDAGQNGIHTRAQRTSPYGARIASMRRTHLSFAILAALIPAAASASPSALEQWKDYAGASIAPEFDWYEPAPAKAPSLAPSVRERSAIGSWSLRNVSLSLSALDADWSQGSASRTAAPRSSSFDLGARLSSGRAVNAQFSGTRFGLQVGQVGEFGVSAVVARQQFATQGFGYGDWNGAYDNRRHIGVGAGVHESNTGSAVRLDWQGPLGGSGLALDAAVQSRIEVDPFKAYRGVYSEAGDFDVPGFASIALEAPIGDRLSIAGEVQRVFYRDIPTFTSDSLPTSFLALLGDGRSPAFAWNDLTIFALEARIRDDFGGRWTLRLATQQQPRPTSSLLDQALEELYSDENIGLAYQRDSLRWGQLRVGASYSPVTYFLGSAPYLQRGFQTGRQLEFEAQWTLPF